MSIAGAARIFLNLATLAASVALPPVHNLELPAEPPLLAVSKG
jgi:hypothetical protein